MTVYTKLFTPSIRRLQRDRKITCYPDFLYPERDGRAADGKMRECHASNTSVRITVAAGELWIFPNGHRILLLRPRN